MKYFIYNFTRKEITSQGRDYREKKQKKAKVPLKIIFSKLIFATYCTICYLVGINQEV